MDSDEFRNLISSVQGRVVIDIGTGDGLFVYFSARKNPENFYIGIDANTRPLQKISERIYRKASRGGAANVLFLQASAEKLPDELNGIADEVHVLFPWGSLLKGVATGEPQILHNLRRICSAGVILRVVFTLEPVRDQTQVMKLGLPAISTDLETVLRSRYSQCGFIIEDVSQVAVSQLNDLHTSWANRLRQSRGRTVFVVAAQAT